jgi:chromosome segregation ATPase
MEIPMARRAMVTQESVTEAVEALIAEKLDPTVERVRHKLGGGSYTTINKVLGAVLQNRQSQATQISDVPPDLIEIGQRAVGAIYAAVQRQAASKIELIETDSRKQIDAANHARAEAALEIERLEREAEQATESLVAAQRATQDALGRAERAEATVTAGQAEIQRLERAIVGAQADAQSARESDQEAQKRASRSEDERRAFEAETRKELDQLHKALAQAETKLVSANEKVEQLGDGVRRAETESARLRQEREELQVRVAKAEAGLAAAQAEVQKIAQALERAQEGERRARDETAELRGQLKAGDEKGKK